MIKPSSIDVPDSAKRWLATKYDTRFFISCDEFCEQGKDIPHWHTRELDSAYRLGFERGFDYCVQQFAAMQREKGFSRVREIANVLWQWSDSVLRPWRYKGKGFFRNERNPHPEFQQPESWGDIRARILRRDRACVRCGDILKLEVDHIIEVQHGGLPTDDNLRVLCKVCHKGKQIWDQQ